MALVNQVNKRALMNRREIVRYQLLTHCYMENIPISEADLDCLTCLAMDGEQELTVFCRKIHDLKIFGCTQSVRNAIMKAEKKNLIIKKRKSKKRIFINPELNIQTSGTIMMDIKILCKDAA